MLTFEPLTKENLKEALDLVHSVFGYNPDESDNPDIWYPASLEPEKYPDNWKEWDIKELKYFIAREEGKGPLVGVTGWYTRNSDPEDMIWLGWYCVDPSEKGKGLGRAILEWTIDKVKEDGYKTMRLYTSTNPIEADAQRLYEKLGFELISEEEDPKGEFKILYREKEL